MQRVGIPFRPLYILQRQKGVDTGQSRGSLTLLQQAAQRPGSAAHGYGKDHRVGRDDRLAGSHRIGRAKGVGWNPVRDNFWQVLDAAIHLRIQSVVMPAGCQDRPTLART
jgi:hypothetical protein